MAQVIAIPVVPPVARNFYYTCSISKLCNLTWLKAILISNLIFSHWRTGLLLWVFQTIFDFCHGSHCWKELRVFQLTCHSAPQTPEPHLEIIQTKSKMKCMLCSSQTCRPGCRKQLEMTPQPGLGALRLLDTLVPSIQKSCCPPFRTAGPWKTTIAKILRTS